MTLNATPVVVAVGHDPVDAALELGVAEARRAGCGVHLVHALRHAHDGPEFILITESDRERVGRQALNAAWERASDLADGEVPVTSALVEGSVVPALVSAVPDARMIVVERRALTGPRRLVTRSVSSGVAARARVPVVSVPTGWSAGSDSGKPVTVGVDHPERAGPVLAAAAAAAASRGSPLHVLHSWFLGSVGTTSGASARAERRWEQHAADTIGSVLERLGDVLSDVPTSIEVVRARPADCLVEASRDSCLLVIGRHDPVVPLGSHLGPVAHTVLQRAECPVMVADTRTTDRRAVG